MLDGHKSDLGCPGCNRPDGPGRTVTLSLLSIEPNVLRRLLLGIPPALFLLDSLKRFPRSTSRIDTPAHHGASGAWRLLLLSFSRNVSSQPSETQIMTLDCCPYLHCRRSQCSQAGGFELRLRSRIGRPAHLRLTTRSATFQRAPPHGRD